MDHHYNHAAMGRSKNLVVKIFCSGLLLLSAAIIGTICLSGNINMRNLSVVDPHEQKDPGPMPKMLSSRAVNASHHQCQPNAIVYMAQKKHSSYNRDSYALLKQSLTLLSMNYLASHHDDVNVFIFYTREYTEADLVELESLLPRKGMLHLVDLAFTSYWHIPPWLRHENKRSWSGYQRYSVGYRHMIRWYAAGIWDYFGRLNQREKCNYKYIMRLDEESFIHSKIYYNIFKYMGDHNYVYGYRTCSYEMNQISNLWDMYTSEVPTVQPKRSFVGKNLCGFYNNWSVGDIQFFQSRPVQDFLRFVDREGSIYRKRLGDLQIQTAIVYAFAPQERIHRFLDFTYQHFTNYHGSECPVWGVFASGFNDADGDERIDAFMDKLEKNGCHERNEGGSGYTTTSKIIYLGEGDLSPTYSHLPARFKDGKLKIKEIVAGSVDLPGMKSSG